MLQQSQSSTRFHQNPLGRRTFLLGATAVIGTTLAARGVPVAQAAPGGGLNGIGLSKTEFNARYGEPVPGQGASVYQVGGERFYVTNTSKVPTDLVVSVYWNGTPSPPDAVTKHMAQFLPEDAVLTSIGDAPAAGVGPRLRIDTYTSPLLASVLAGSGFVDSGEMLLAYNHTPDLTGAVSWANLYVGVKPQG